jgi:DNA modification methylase
MALWLNDEMQFDQAVVWNKGGLGLGWRYRHNYEFVMVAHPRRGTMKWEADFCDKRTANVVDIPRVPPKKGAHPTPKPVELVRHFLALHGKRGDVVCDPFAGAGTTCVAAKSLGMRYIACELDPKWHAVAERRIAEMDGRPMKRIGARTVLIAARQQCGSKRKMYRASHAVSFGLRRCRL